MEDAQRRAETLGAAAPDVGGAIDPQRRLVAGRSAALDVEGAIDHERRAALVRVASPDVVGAHLDRRIAELASTQGGVAGRTQLRAVGLSTDAIRHRLRTGRLIAVHRGVYAVGHGAIGETGRLHAALLAAGPSAIISHRAAAALLELIPSMPPSVDVTVTGTRARRSRPGLTIHETRVPPPTHHVHGLPLTRPLRTLTDLAKTRPTAELERACAEALVLNFVTEQELIAARLLPPERTAPTRSELERRFLRLVHGAGLPRPRVNHPVAPYVVDFAWLDHKVIVETDGYAAHGRRAAYTRDRARDADLLARGYVVLRFTWRQIVDEPLLVAARLAQVLARREAVVLTR